MTRRARPATATVAGTTTLRCSVCGAIDWIAGYPGSEEQTTADDGETVLLHPIPAIPQQIWCESCWPWLKNRKAATS